MTDAPTAPAPKTKLTDDQVAVSRLVSVVPEPRTAEELSKRYAGLRTENLWPEQTPKAVRERIEELVKAGTLKKGPKAPDGDPVIEVAE